MPQSPSKKTIDFVMVIKGELKPAVNTFIQSMKKCGLQIEFANGQKVQRTFILIVMSQKTLENYAKLFNVIEETKAQRNRLKFAPAKNEVYSSAQRLLVLSRLLETISFGVARGEFGLTRLIKLKAVEAAYPLHDGTYDGDIECMRKFLWNEWANAPFFSIAQPLDDIQQYYGWEIGFYFAWLEFFIKMLLPVAIIGLLVFVISIILGITTNVYPVIEICEEHNMYVCPICDNMANCIFRRLSSYCFYGKWNYILDNYLTICFAIGMSFWTPLVLHLWTRKESDLKYKWDVEFEEIETIPRPAYLYRFLLPRIYYRFEFCLKYINVLNISLTVSTIVFLVIAMVAAYLAIIAYRLSLSRLITGISVYEEFLATVVASLFLVIFIHIFEAIYHHISILLTNIENPKLQRDYEKSALYKRFILSFVNNFSFLFYIAFAKGRTFSTPLSTKISFMDLDSCQPSTCMLALCVQLGLLMLLKRFIWNIFLLIYILVREVFQKVWISTESLPQYEMDYGLKAVREDFFLYFFCESVIEFGYVTFFVAAFPLAPLIALWNNLFIKRLVPILLTSRRRRPCPKKICGIAEWNGILRGLTYMSTATNAFVTAFTSDFVWRQIYAVKYDASFKGYINSTLSSFATEDSPIYRKVKDRATVCYYNGYRNPYDAPNKYHPSSNMWLNLAWRLIHVFIFENTIFFCNALWTSLIPKTPFMVREQKTLDKFLANKVKWQQMSDKEKKAKRGKFFILEIRPNMFNSFHIQSSTRKRKIKSVVK